MESIINQHVISDLNKLHDDFRNARPFRHVVIDDFLRPEVAEAMLAQFPSVDDPSKLLNEFGAPNPKSAISDVRSLAKPFVDVDSYIQTREFLDLMSAVTGIPDLRYDPWYYGAGTHENFHGAGLDAHYDFNIHPKTAYHRRLNAIVYLNKDWNPEWRGDIAFHTDPWDLKNDIKKSVQPAFNRCVIFETTENSWHSVTPVKLPEELRHLSRKSFTIYLYTVNRPNNELAPEHGTVYVHPPLPERIREGRTLDAEDVAEIESNIFRRHDYLKNMYKREYRFSIIIDDLKRQNAEWKRASYVPVLGNAKVKEVLSPLYPDGWMGEELAFDLELRQDVSALVLNLWLPDSVDDTYNIRFQVQDRYVDSWIGRGSSSIEIRINEKSGSKVSVKISSDSARQGSEVDLRRLSVVVDSITLK